MKRMTMMKRMTIKILLGSLRRCMGRTAVAIFAVALGASLIVATFNLRQGIKRKLAGELRNYGANLVLLPGNSEAFLKESSLAALEEKAIKSRLAGYAPFFYRIAQVGRRDLVLVGTRFDSARSLSSWWRITGRMPDGRGEALVGANVAAKLGLRPGSRFEAVYRGARVSMVVVGILQTGGAEEHQILVDLKELQEIAGQRDSVNSVLLSHRPDQDLVETSALLQRAFPEANLRTVLQVVQAEEILLERLEIFLTLVGLVIVFASGLSVFATMTAAALERRAEIALMRALGAREKDVARIFCFEAASIGTMGGIIGVLLGFLFAVVIGFSVFKSWIPPSPLALPVGIVAGVGVSLLASLPVVRRIATLSPGPILKGE